MPDKPTPTDAELKAMWQLHAADIGGIFYYARAVLAKWGQPAQAAEPVSQPQKNAIRQAFDEGAEYSANEWRGRVETAQLELEAYRKAYQTLLEQVAKGVSIMRPPPLVISAPQPVERVPLTDGLEMALEQLVNRCNNDHDSCTWDEVIAAEAALERLYKSRAIEAEHGIKGGQHVS